MMPSCDGRRDDGWHLAKCRSLNMAALTYRVEGSYWLYRSANRKDSP